MTASHQITSIPKDSEDLHALVLEVVSPFVRNRIAIDIDTPLVDQRLLDSINIIQITLALEQRLGISIGPADVSFDDFASCRRLAKALRPSLRLRS